MSDIVRVRIAVAVDPKGRWYAYGFSTADGGHGPRNHDELLEIVDSETLGPAEAHFWVVADLPIPQVQIVEADEITAA